jgi:carbon storage regulator
VLVLTAKVNQSIAIGAEIRITIAGIEGNKVKLGVVAPPQLAIQRLAERGPQRSRTAQDDRAT